MLDRLTQAVHTMRGIGRIIFFVLILVPLAFLFSVLVLAASSAAIAMSILLLLTYRIFWLGTVEGRFYRCAQKNERYKEKIRKKELVRRIRLSRLSDRQNIRELISIIRAELEKRKNDIRINISVLARIKLQECRRTLDFDAAMDLYQTLAHASGSINHRLGPCVGLNWTVDRHD